MMLYKIVLCLIIFGAVTGMMNTLNFYGIQSPTTGNEGITEEQATGMASAVSNSPLNMITGYFVLMLLLNMLLSAFLAVITVIPFLTAWGVPFALATAIQIPIWLVFAKCGLGTAPLHRTDESWTPHGFTGRLCWGQLCSSFCSLRLLARLHLPWSGRTRPKAMLRFQAAMLFIGETG